MRVTGVLVGWVLVGWTVTTRYCLLAVSTVAPEVMVLMMRMH